MHHVISMKTYSAILTYEDGSISTEVIQAIDKKHAYILLDDIIDPRITPYISHIELLEVK
jgi:hypothetical protein